MVQSQERLPWELVGNSGSASHLFTGGNRKVAADQITKLEASSEGYETTPLVVDETTPKQLDVSLKPLKRGEGDANATPAAP